MKTVILLTLLLLSTLNAVSSEKILFFITWSSHSHRVAMQPLADKLSERGHEVTFFSPFKPETPNPKIKEFCPSELLALNDMMLEASSSATSLGRLKDRYYDQLFEGTILWDTCFMILSATANSPEFQKWMSESSFDLIITDSPCKEISYGMAHILESKIVAMTSTATPIESDMEMLGAPTEASWLHGWLFDSKWWFIPNSFVYAWNGLTWYFSFKNYYLPKVDGLLRDVFKSDDLPRIEELMTKVDLVLLNEHFSVQFPRALPPFHIPVAGMHIKNANGTLPKNIDDFIKDTGKEDFIYISFGSAIQISKLPLEFQKVLFDTVSSFPKTKFLWKWEGDMPESLPKNVLALKWFPQQEVLAHPKCKGFVTQGGQMSVHQAIYYQVPMVVSPGFGDQTYNARVVVHHRIGIHLELVDITKETFSDALSQLLHNEELSKQVKEVSRRFKDKPMSPVDTATWWVEYVLRHDTAHLRSAYVTQTWWKKRQLDFWGLVFSAIAILLVMAARVVFMAVRFLIRLKVSKKAKTA